jgi:transcriptional regulator with XRE-family HTH domain
MERQTVGKNLIVIRERRMWTQARLAKEAGVSPTTVSGIETGRISRPHFGTLRRLARALGVDPQALLSPEQPISAEFNEQGRPAPLSLEWARAAGEEEFERKVEQAPLKRLQSLSQELEEEQRRLRRLYGEFPEGSEQRRFIKQQIRDLSAHSGSVTTSMMFHAEEDSGKGTNTEREVTEVPTKKKASNGRQVPY